MIHIFLICDTKQWSTIDSVTWFLFYIFSKLWRIFGKNVARCTVSRNYVRFPRFLSILICFKCISIHANERSFSINLTASVPFFIFLVFFYTDFSLRYIMLFIWQSNIFTCISFKVLSQQKLCKNKQLFEKENDTNMFAHSNLTVSAQLSAFDNKTSHR